MKAELQNLLESWKDARSQYVERRRVEVAPNQLMSGEYKIKLIMEGRIVISAPGRNVEKAEIIYTFAQGSDDENIDPAGDIYRVKRLMNKLENNFFEELDNEVTNQLREINTDGFF